MVASSRAIRSERDPLAAVDLALDDAEVHCHLDGVESAGDERKEKGRDDNNTTTDEKGTASKHTGVGEEVASEGRLGGEDGRSGGRGEGLLAHRGGNDLRASGV